jgi:thiol-disulfide isomerase/thioredoxin
MKIIDFGAMWCPGCLIMRPRLNEIKKLYPDIEVIEYDYDENEDLVEKFSIGNILPVFIFTMGDKETPEYKQTTVRSWGTARKLLQLIDERSA